MTTAIAPRAHERGKISALRRGYRRAAGDGQRETVDEEQRAKRRHERGNTQVYRYRTIDKPHHTSGQHAHDQRDPCWRACLVRKMHDERRKREHHAGGEINLATNHQHDFAARDNRHRRDELRQVFEAGAGQQKVVVGDFEVGGQNQRDRQNANLAGAPDRARPAPGATTGFRRICHR
jgi:hypothetical protein